MRGFTICLIVPYLEEEKLRRPLTLSLSKFQEHLLIPMDLNSNGTTKSFIQWKISLPSNVKLMSI